jgi:hypothetical protein
MVRYSFSVYNTLKSLNYSDPIYSDDEFKFYDSPENDIPKRLRNQTIVN